MGNKRTFILWGMVYLAVAFMAVLIYTEKEKKYRKETSRNAFWNAVRQEKETGIREVVFRYRQDNSPNELSEEEKRNWCDQAFLLTEDPDRVRLDSLFHAALLHTGIQAASAVGYTYRGKTYFSGNERLRKSATLVEETTYRKDHDKTNDITIRAYVQLPEGLLLPDTSVCLLVMLPAVILAGTALARLYRNRQTGSRTTETEEKTDNGPEETSYLQRQTTAVRWTVIRDGYWWDNRHHVLKHQDRTVTLGGESLRFFLLFIAQEDFFISHKDIGRLYDEKEPTAMNKDRAYHSIKQLKGLVSALDIGIHSVRGKGYRMSFPAAEDAPKTV